MWLDHRAVSQVHRINETKHSVLQYVGGVMSVEMQAPKLLWLKEVSGWGEERALTIAEWFLYPLKVAEPIFLFRLWLIILFHAPMSGRHCI